MGQGGEILRHHGGLTGSGSSAPRWDLIEAHRLGVNDLISTQCANMLGIVAIDTGDDEDIAVVGELNRKGADVAGGTPDMPPSSSGQPRILHIR
jgi:hypothetical protein